MCAAHKYKLWKKTNRNNFQKNSEYMRSSYRLGNEKCFPYQIGMPQLYLSIFWTNSEQRIVMFNVYSGPGCLSESTQV